MTAREFSPQITNGKLPEATQRAIDELLKGLEGKRVTITIKEAKRPRTLKQNALLWADLYPPIVRMFRQHGNDVDEDDIHEYCKTVVAKLRRVIVLPDGTVKQMPGSTKRLNTEEMSNYIEQVRAYFAPYGLVWG